MTTKTIKRAQLRGPRDLVFEDVVLNFGDLSDGEIAAETEVTAVSVGTEVAAYAGHPPLRPGPTYPRKVGYCNVARVTHVGARVQGIQEGARILTHQSHQSGFICSAGDVLATVPDEVSSERASLAYLAVLGLHALHHASYRPGETVAVVGLGAIGLSTVALCHAVAAPVMAAGRHHERLSLARELGADATIDTDAGYPSPTISPTADHADVVVLTASSWSAWKVARELPGDHGRIAVVGFPGRTEGSPAFNPLDSAYLYDKQLSIVAAGQPVMHVHGPLNVESLLRKNVRYVLDLMRRGRLPLERVITVRERWDRLADLYERCVGEKSIIGAVLRWR